MITKSSPLASRLLAYTKERFPLVPVIILVTLMCGASAHLHSRWFGFGFSWQDPKFIGTIVTVFLFMLGLRMSDEIKDYDKDCKAYPERLLSQGIVTLKHIRIVLLTVIGIEFLINLCLGVSQLILLILLHAYAYLMYKEFFAKEFLEKRMALYLISHQLILIPLMVYCALPFVPGVLFLENISILYPILYLCLPYTVYELSRKTWSKDRENENADSYTKSWGIEKTLIIEMSLVVLIALLMNKMAVILPFAHKLTAGVLFLVYFATLMVFKKDPTRKKSKVVELGGSILLLGLYALCSFLI